MPFIDLDWPDDFNNEPPAQDDPLKTIEDMDGEFRPASQELVYSSSIGSRIVYVETLIRIVPTLQSDLENRLTHSYTITDIEKTVSDWAQKYHLDQWIVEMLLRDDAWGGEQTRALLVHHESVAQKRTDEHLSRMKFPTHPKQYTKNELPIFQFEARIDPFTHTFSFLTEQIERRFEKEWKKYLLEIKKYIEHEKGKQRTQIRVREEDEPIRHFEWLARYQSNNEIPIDIAKNPSIDPTEATQAVTSQAVYNAIKKTATHIGVERRKNKERRGRPRKQN